jgi:glycosyltransferase involved in cell wall biosynthesis
MKIFFSKSLTYPANCNIPLPSHILQLYDERLMLAKCGKKNNLVRADTLVCINLFLKIIANIKKYDIFVTGRYGDIFAVFQGVFSYFKRPLILLDTEWPNRRKEGLLRKIGIVLHRLLARGSSKIQVFCQSEIQEYSKYYGIDESKFVWIPFCTDEFGPDWSENNEEEYIFTGGLQQRDWETLYYTVKDLPINVCVVAPHDAIDKRFIAQNMKLTGKVEKKEYFKLMAKSKLVVLAVEPSIMRSPGVITYVYAMRMGKCIVLNDLLGANSYIENGKTGVLIEPKKPELLKAAIVDLLNDDSRRRAIGRAAREYALSHYSGQRYFSDLEYVVREVGKHC